MFSSLFSVIKNNKGFYFAILTFLLLALIGVGILLFFLRSGQPSSEIRQLTQIKESLLSHDPYDPTFLPEPLEGNGGWFESSREEVISYLDGAIKSLEEGNIPKAKEWLEKAADKFANTSFDGEGTERYKPQTEEEAENYEYWGKKRGVSRVWLKEYLQVVKAINKL